MILEQVVQGRSIGEAEIGLIRTLLSKNPDWHRTRLSRELCPRSQESCRLSEIETQGAGDNYEKVLRKA